MKTLSLAIILIIGTGLINTAYSQSCVSCYGTTNTGLYSTAINFNTQALGEYSFPWHDFVIRTEPLSVIHHKSAYYDN